MSCLGDNGLLAVSYLGEIRIGDIPAAVAITMDRKRTAEITRFSRRDPG